MSVTGAAAREGRFSRLIMPFELRSGELFRNFKRKRLCLRTIFDCIVQEFQLRACAMSSVRSRSMLVKMKVMQYGLTLLKYVGREIPSVLHPRGYQSAAV